MNKADYSTLPPGARIDRARRLAYVAHAGHRNKKNGEDYILHPARVAAHAESLVVGLRGDEEAVVVAAAWLHDTIEDTPVTAEMLTDLGFESRVVHLVELLTRRSEVPAQAYYAAIAADPLARFVKLADLADNTDPERLALLEPSLQDKLCRKYAAAYAALDVEPPAHVIAGANAD